MISIEQLYAAAARAGLLVRALWRRANARPLGADVSFVAPEELILDGLAAGTDYTITFPASVFIGMKAGDSVEVDGVTYRVRSVRPFGDGSERRATLTRP